MTCHYVYYNTFIFPVDIFEIVEFKNFEFSSIYVTKSVQMRESVFRQLVEEENVRGIVSLTEEFETEGITNSTEVSATLLFTEKILQELSNLV